MAKAKKGLWIPAEILSDPRLTPLDKLIFSAVLLLDDKERGCFASNAYLASLCGCGKTKVSTSIAKLEALSYLTIASRRDPSRILKANLSPSESPPFKTCDAPLQKTNQSSDSFPLIIENKSRTSECERRADALPTRTSICSGVKRKKMDKTLRDSPPSLEDVRAYCSARGNHVNPERFVTYFDARDWQRKDGSPVDDWQAEIRAWEANGLDSPAAPPPQTSFDTDEFFQAALKRSYGSLEV